MDSYEWNKIIGWVLAGAIAVLGLSILTGFVYPGHAPEQKGYIVEGVEHEASEATEEPAEMPISMFMADASISKGEAQFKKCAACHTIAKGGPSGQGPNLYGIVGSKIAHVAGFGYSDAVQNHGGTWGFDELSAWLKSPKAFIPGNKMSFAGIGKDKDRADLLAYLNAQSDSPLPMPTPPAVAAEEAPADEATAETAEAAPAEAAETH